MSATSPNAATEQLADRDVRALTEPMDIYAEDPATSETEVAVYNDGTRHIVSPETGFCTCKDHEYRQPEGGCKHLRAVQFARGEREIPEWADPDAVAEHIDSGVDA